MGGFLTLVEPVVIVNTMGSTFYETALSLSIYKRALETAEGRSDQAQAIASHFLLLYYCLSWLLSFVSTVLLGWLARRRGPRLLLVLPQVGTVVRTSLLLAFVRFQLPLAVLYAGAAAYGLSGGSPAYWSALVWLSTLSSGEERRSLKLNAVDFCYGMAGVVGGLLSGFLYPLGQSGVPLIAVSILLCAGSLLYSAFLLSIPRPPGGDEVSAETGGEAPASQPAVFQEAVWSDRRGVATLFAAIVLFDLGMSGAEDVLTLYVQKPPLSWDSVWLGYGSAATNAMYLSSFLGVLLLSRRLGDTALILLGVASNCTGMAIMAFATRSWVYFFARGIMMFSCIPMPTIKAQLSKKLDTQLYGRVFGWLQATLALTTVLSGLFYTSIYPLTLGWYSGFSFLISCTISYLSVIPMLYLHCRGTRQGYVPISGNDEA